MKGRLSLQAIVIIAVLVFTGILVLGFSVLSARFFSLGVSHVIVDNMEIAVEKIHRDLSEDSLGTYRYWGSYRVTRDWSATPEGVRKVFAEPIAANGKLQIARSSSHSGEKGPDYYLLATTRDNSIYYVSQWAGFSTPLGTFGWNSNENIRFLIVLCCLVGCGIVTVLWLLIRRISQPIVALNAWANRLEGDSVKDVIPDFSYRELNELALLLQDKVAAEHYRLETDRQFLNYTSHELRTPITIIGHNVELLEKILSQDDNQPRTLEKEAVNRLKRAVDNMGALMETLLWLGRNTNLELACEEIRLDRLLAETVENLRFLINGREIEISLDTESAILLIPKIPLEIILANLVRNAFHHTPMGRVSIIQKACSVTITNTMDGWETGSGQGTGFGLNLTAKLIKKMGWCYQSKKGLSEYTVSVVIEDSC